MSPRRWMSTQSLQNTETTSEGSGFYLLSSQQRLRQHGKLLSLYAVHREKYGHPRVIPDSVLRYFNSGVRQNTSGNNDSFLGETSSGEHQLDNGSEEASLAKTDTFPDESEFSHSWSKPYSNRKTVQLCNSSKENKDSPTSERLCYRIYSDKSANLSKTEIEIDGKSPGFTGPGNRTARVLRDSIEYQNKNEEIVQEIVKSGCSLSRHASDENINNIQVTEVSRTKIARNALHPNELNATCPPETRKSLTITFHSVKNSAFLEGDENKLADKETTEKFSQTELPECGEETSLHCVPGMLNREAILQISHTNETEAISSNIQFSGETFDDLTESDRSWNHKMSNVTASCLRMSSSIAKQVVIFVLDSFSSNRRTGSKTDVALHSAGTLRKLSFEVFANSLAQNMVRLAIDDSIKLKQERVERQVVSNHKINDPSLEHFSYFGSTLADVIMTDVKTTTRQLKACRRCTSAILQGCLQIITFAKQEAEQIMTTAAGILQTTSEEHLIDKLANSVVEKAISSALFNMKDDFDSDTSFKCQKQTATESSWLEDKQCYRTVLFAKVKDHTDMPLETHISESEVAKGDNLLAESETSSHQSTFNNTAQRISQSEISFTNSPIPFHCHEESSTANLVDCFVDDLVPQERSLSLDCLLQPTALILEQCVNFGLRRSASADSFFVSAFKASSEIVNNRLLEKLCDSTSVEPFSKTSSSIPSAVTTKAIEEEKGPGEQPLQQNHSDTSSEIEFSPESSSIPDQKNVIGAEAESSCVNSDVNAAILSFLPALEERSETTKLQSTPANNQIVGDDGCEQDEEKIFSLPVFFHHSVEECVMKNDRAEKESEPAHTQATESASAELSTCELLEEAGAENSLPGEGNIQATACDTHLTANISEKSMAETASNQTVLQKMSTVSGEVLQRRKKFPVVDEEVYEKYAETTARTRSKYIKTLTKLYMSSNSNFAFKKSFQNRSCVTADTSVRAVSRAQGTIATSALFDA